MSDSLQVNNLRPLGLSASRGCWVNLLKVRSAGVLSRHRHRHRHRHPQPVLNGSWRYLERGLGANGLGAGLVDPFIR